MIASDNESSQKSFDMVRDQEAVGSSATIPTNDKRVYFTGEIA